MIRGVLFAACCLLAVPAEAARIQDMSLTPRESLQQPDIVNATAPLGGQPAYDNEAAADAYISGTATRRFMDGYCDASVRPAVSGANALQTCMQEARADACARFQQLPPDAQEVIDRAVACGYAAGEDGAMPDECADNSDRQLQLLRKYWGDQNTAQALVFLPDKVNNPAALCQGK